jgi:predicted porin
MEESLGDGFVLIGKAETNFNPLSMQLADACAALVENNGKGNPATQVSAANGSRCGQPFAGQYYAGLSNASYGTLTGGRQSSLQNDTIGAYDPMGGSYAFSLIGFSGTADGGIGTS